MMTTNSKKLILMTQSQFRLNNTSTLEKYIEENLETVGRQPYTSLSIAMAIIKDTQERKHKNCVEVSLHDVEMAVARVGNLTYKLN